MAERTLLDALDLARIGVRGGHPQGPESLPPAGRAGTADRAGAIRDTDTRGGGRRYWHAVIPPDRRTTARCGSVRRLQGAAEPGEIELHQRRAARRSHAEENEARPTQPHAWDGTSSDGPQAESSCCSTDCSFAAELPRDTTISTRPAIIPGCSLHNAWSRPAAGLTSGSPSAAAGIARGLDVQSDHQPLDQHIRRDQP